MIFKYIEQQTEYDGSQLRSLYAYLSHSVHGDSIVAWQGACHINWDKMVDGEDLLDRSEIRGSHMLHFIIEKFEANLLSMVSLQRLFASEALEVLREMAPSKTQGMRREGDDLWMGQKKLSISIATLSPISGLVHFALNIKNEGTPVETLSLSDLQVDAKDFAVKLGEKFAREVEQILYATRKVKWVF